MTGGQFYRRRTLHNIQWQSTRKQGKARLKI